ncbi:MAG: nicotinate-nucleotide adenylyltransferase [Candidatus Omnitrophica bacterium]|nr:nicotinate-nucleotide adenylyltransferase [Candidatus Omnitrophota bacterium]
MKLGIFGGTFDPIHVGHLEIAHAVHRQFLLDKIIFVPTRIPPHKVSRSDITPASQRYEMIQIAIQKESYFEVSDIEIKRSGISYTVDTLRELRKKYPEAELFFILGADSLTEISGWRETDEIKKMARLIVAPRESHRVSGKMTTDPNIQWLKMPTVPLSSSEIRERIRGSRSVLGLLPEGVEDYIQKMKLYRESS